MSSGRGALRPNLQHCPSTREEIKLHEGAVWSATPGGQTRNPQPQSGIGFVATATTIVKRVKSCTSAGLSTTVRAREMEK